MTQDIYILIIPLQAKSGLQCSSYLILKDGDSSITSYSVGNDIGNLEMVRWALRTQFDRDVVTHYECQVHCIRDSSKFTLYTSCIYTLSRSFF